MGTLTLAEMMSELIAYHGNRNDITDTRKRRFINMAQERIARTHDFEDLEVLDTSISCTYNQDDNDRFVTPPANTKKIRSIVLLDDAESRKLKFRTPRQVDDLVPKPEYWSRGHPSYYTKYENTLELLRLPDAAYSLRFRIAKWPTRFAENGDDDSNTSDYNGLDDLIIMLAAIVGYNSLGNVDKGKKLWPIYASLINDAVGEDVERPDLERGPAYNMPGIRGDYWRNPFIVSVEDS